MKRIYLLAYITILCCLCPLLKAQLGPMPFTPVPPNDPSLVRLLNSDVRCRQWVDSVMQRLTLKERIGQLFIYTIAPQQDKANKELLRKVVEDYKVLLPAKEPGFHTGDRFPAWKLLPHRGQITA